MPHSRAKIDGDECAVPGCDRPRSGKSESGRSRYCAAHQSRLQRTGDVQADKPLRAPWRPIVADVCEVPGCDRPCKPNRLCPAHRQRKLVHGDVMADKPIRPMHRGAVDVWCDYKTAHGRVAYARGRATEHQCIDCDGQAHDWSYRGQARFEFSGPAALSSGKISILRWSGDPADYDPRCRPCHRRYDSAG